MDEQVAVVYTRRACLAAADGNVLRPQAAHTSETPESVRHVAGGRRGALVDERARGGSLTAPVRASVGGYAIGTWLAELRAAAQVPAGQPGALTPQRRAALEEIDPWLVPGLADHLAVGLRGGRAAMAEVRRPGRLGRPVRGHRLRERAARPLGTRAPVLYGRGTLA